MNLRQQERFYQFMNRVKVSSRAASTTGSRITEMINGLLVSKALKKEPVVIDLQEYARSGKSFGGGSSGNINVNKVRMIHDFIASHGY